MVAGFIRTTDSLLPVRWYLPQARQIMVPFNVSDEAGFCSRDFYPAFHGNKYCRVASYW